jgi:tetratricopeptide (TPR) repeat protein
MAFEVYPPRPPEKLIKDRLAGVAPLVSLRAKQEVVRLDVHRPGEELAEIEQALQGISGVEVYVHPAATPGDVLSVLQSTAVDVLHFAGHGEEQGGLLFEDGRGGARRVNPQELARLVGGRVKLLITGACYSARALSALFPPDSDEQTALPAAIAVDGEYPIPSRAVQLFGGAFYAAAARGQDLAAAFASGVEAVRFDDYIGERRLPDGADRGMPSPWKRFRHFGDSALAWPSNGQARAEIRSLVNPTLHRKLPRTDDLFVGRGLEMAATVEALDPPRAGIAEHKPRVVTLHGEGGIGKTRLSGAVAEWLAERGRFPGGIVEVDCERPTNAAELAVAILGALGVQQPQSVPDPPAALTELLGASPAPRLLVLDNLENLFPGNGDPTSNARDASQALHSGVLLKQCLTASPTLRILATSRWPLYLGGDENAFELDPLRQEEAEDLFVLSVHHQDLRDELLGMPSKQRSAALADILRATERMPLALVLAARRLPDPGQDLEGTIRQASQDLLALCQDERLTHLPARLRSVRASLQLSYQRLSEPAQVLFARMSGGLFRAFEPLGQLLGEGWQQLAHGAVIHFALARYGRQQDRYSLLHPVRVFAGEKLDQGEGDAFRRQAVEFWAGAAAAYVPLLRPSQLAPETLSMLNLPGDPEQRGIALEHWRTWAFTQLLMQEDNLIAAADWALRTREEIGDRLLRAVDPYLDVRSLWHTQEQLYSLAAARAERGREQDAAFLWRGYAAIVLRNLHRWDEAKAVYERVLAGYRTLAAGNPDAYLPNVAATLNNLGNLLKNLGEREAARGHYEEALEIYRPFFEKYPRAYIRNVLIVLNGLRQTYEALGLQSVAQQCREAIERLRSGNTPPDDPA